MSAKYSTYLFILISSIALHGFASGIQCAENKKERTFVLLKPDCVQRGFIGQVIQRFERRGLKLVAMKFMWATREMAEDHYEEHIDRPFYPQLIKYLTSGPVVPMIWEGLNAVIVARQLIGASSLMEAMPGTIRYAFSIDRSRNVIHGSHSVDAANREIQIWFDEKEIVSYTLSNIQWITS